MTEPAPVASDNDVRPHNNPGGSPGERRVREQLSDPAETDYPTGEQQAAENAATESPA